MTLTRFLSFVGLSCRDLVLTYKHKLLMIFKLIMLEKRVCTQIL